MSSIVRVEALSKHYGSNGVRLEVLKGIDLNIEEGEFVAVMGPSGSGKSTLLHLIGGLDRPSGGRVWIKDRALNDLDDKGLSQLRRQQIGFVFQFFNLLAVLSARENVAMPLILDGVKRAAALQRAEGALEAVGLADRKDHRPAELSGGQQQRVAIARALVIKPALIMGDEPTGALDTRTGDEVVNLLRQSISQERRTLVVVTHDARVAAHADRIIYLKDGEIVDDNRLNSGERPLAAPVSGEAS
ncbi:MAG: ABC transporter ATP-binding protein [Chloroflexi bacterium]|nr:ABC transporter ATP-binding protein [Chloroflexota bacterium]